MAGVKTGEVAGCGSPAQTLRLDRTRPLICSAAELVPFAMEHERNFTQSSPSAFAEATAERICSASAVSRASCIRDAPLSHPSGQESHTGQREKGELRDLGPPVLAQRAASESPRWTRAVGGKPRHPAFRMSHRQLGGEIQRGTAGGWASTSAPPVKGSAIVDSITATLEYVDSHALQDVTLSEFRLRLSSAERWTLLTPRPTRL